MADEAILRALSDTPLAIRPDMMGLITEALEARLRGLGPEVAGDEQTRGILGARGVPAPRRGAVAVIPIMGAITPRPRLSLFDLLFGGGGASITTLQAALRAAMADRDVGAILLDFDSPGGYVDLVPEFGEELRRARSKKPIVAVADTGAASAAYWLAAQASEIFVTPSGQVGSIGVYALHVDWSRFDEKLGVKTTLISAGRYKTEANPYEPLGETAEAAIQSRVDEVYDMFVRAVAAGRDVSEAKVRGGFGEGRMVSAERAVAGGMADRVGTFDDALGRAAELARGGPLGGGTARGGIAKPSPRTEEPEGSVQGAERLLDRLSDPDFRRAWREGGKG